MKISPWTLFFSSLQLIVITRFTYAQQEYLESDRNGYSCAANVTQCTAYASYRALQSDTLRSVGLRFGLSEQQVAAASGISDTAILRTDQLVLIPFNCSCVSGRTQYNVSYIIQSGDTYYLVSNNTFQGLTTWQAVERANPSYEPTKLNPGDKITFPIRCGCPSTQQSDSGVKSLLTYGVWPNDSIEKIASNWNVSQDSITKQNTVSSNRIQDSDLQAFTTLLLPITQDKPKLPGSSLSSPPPAAPPPPQGTAAAPSSSSSSKTGTYVGIAVGVVAAVALVGIAGFFYWRKTRKLSKSSKTTTNGSSYTASNKDEFGTFSSSMNSATGYAQQPPQNDVVLAGMNDLVDSEKPLLFSYQELQEATNDFAESHRIQGSVYRGVLRKQLVAIKEMKGGTTSQELKILCKVHHSNLVKLVGVCSGENNLFLVYEYAENGSLNKCLHNKNPASFKLKEDIGSASSAFLSWNTRLQIALDVASGLEYIHDYTKPSFVHKDVKSSNILLDEHFRAKIANFGMARLVGEVALTKHIAGTQGYMSPEYLAHGFVTTKVDVYAFGVVLLELLTGREAILDSPVKGYLAEVFVDLTDEMKELDTEGKKQKLKEWTDPVLEDAFPWDGVFGLLDIARSCVDKDPDKRPNMKEVTFKLSKLLDSSLEWETTAVLNRRYNSAQLQGR